MDRFSPVARADIRSFSGVLSVGLQPMFVASHALTLRHGSRTRGRPCNEVVGVYSAHCLVDRPKDRDCTTSGKKVCSLARTLTLSLTSFRVAMGYVSPK